MERKELIRIIGGGQDSQWGKQFRQQDRVYDKKGVSIAINAVGNNGCVVRRYKKIIECPEIAFESVKALNAYPNGTCRTIKAQYIKNGLNNFFRTDNYGATGVIRKRRK